MKGKQWRNISVSILRHNQYNENNNRNNGVIIVISMAMNINIMKISCGNMKAESS